jgi:hypothetical protein
MTEETKYIEETYRGCPIMCEESTVKALADMGIDAMQELRNKIDDVYDTERTFSEALYELKAGTKMRRKSWPADRFVYLVSGSTFTVSRPPLNKLFTDGREINYQAHIDVFEGESEAAVWHATNADLLADDWHAHG